MQMSTNRMFFEKDVRKRKTERENKNKENEKER